MILLSFPLSKRSIYAGICGAAEATASLSAPLIGGVLTDRLSWRWCFYIELPLIGVTFMIVALFFNANSHQGSLARFSQKLAQLDLLGTALFVPSLTSLMLGLQFGGNKYGWGNGRIIAMFCIFAVLLFSFIWLQYRKQDRTTLPPRIISQRNIVFGFIFSCCNNAASSIVEYYVSLAAFCPPTETKNPSHAFPKCSILIFLIRPSQTRADAYLFPGGEGPVSVNVWGHGSPGCCGPGSVCVLFWRTDIDLGVLHSLYAGNQQHNTSSCRADNHSRRRC